MNLLSGRLAGRGFVLLAVGMFVLGGCRGSGTALARKGVNATALYAKGDKSYQAGDRTAATRDLEAAVAADPKLLMARERLGDVYKDDGRYEDAMNEYRELARLDPYGPTSYYKLGVTQQLLNRPDDAAKNYQKALKLDPREWKSRMNLGLVRLSQGKMDEAVDNTKQATQAAPKEADVWSNYGVALDASGKPVEAEQAYRMSLSLKPNQAGTMANLGRNLLTQKKFDDAASVLAGLVSIENSAMARRMYGDALTGQGKSAEAQVQYAEAKKLKK